MTVMVVVAEAGPRGLPSIEVGVNAGSSWWVREREEAARRGLHIPESAVDECGSDCGMRKRLKASVGGSCERSEIRSRFGVKIGS